jgi:hypothetical protein
MGKREVMDVGLILGRIHRYRLNGIRDGETISCEILMTQPLPFGPCLGLVLIPVLSVVPNDLFLIFHQRSQRR